jgi:phosphomannomutase
MSAHHYFRDFAYADSGMIPWLLVAQLMSVSGKPLSELVGERIAKYPASGEINRKVADANATLKKLHDRYAADSLAVDDIDGYCFEFADWRFNIRMSNTEPVVRLNVESRGDQALMEARTEEVLNLMSEE